MIYIKTVSKTLNIIFQIKTHSAGLRTHSHALNLNVPALLLPPTYRCSGATQSYTGVRDVGGAVRAAAL